MEENFCLTQNAIEARKSTRTFRNAPLSHMDLEKISSYLSDTTNLVGPFGNQIDFELVVESDTQEKEQIGTYGFIQNAQGYILLAAAIKIRGVFSISPLC